MTELTNQILAGLGWSAHFARQLEADETRLTPARLSAVHRDRLESLGPSGPLSLIPAEPAGHYAVGDWVLCDGPRALRRLAPYTQLTRRAAGTRAETQRIAANVDTVGIVTSCNADFNVARLERYLAMVTASGALPLVILTKADLAIDPRDDLMAAQRLSPLVTALALNATDPDEVARLHPWCRDGQTLALVGSSGVGKTTLRNALTAAPEGATQAIREDDARGRHTTTARELVPTGAGGWLIDTPGMRELQLADAAEGIGAVFEDIAALARDCRFRDCAHEAEPGCAVAAALADGRLDPARLERWRKLQREDAHNNATLAEARARDKAFGKMVRGVMAAKSKQRR